MCVEGAISIKLPNIFMTTFIKSTQASEPKNNYYF